VDLAIAQIRANEARGAVSNVLVHPITMYLADGFAGFDRLLGEIARHETVWMSETLTRRTTRRVRHEEATT
jgi:hypothetical protein